MRLGVFGAGYVGLVTAACFAERGHTVAVCDTDAAKVSLLQSGRVPFFEPGLAVLIARNADAGRLSFTTQPAEVVKGCAIVFIAVGTPSAPDGRADVSGVRDAAIAIANAIDGPLLVVLKSTIPIESAGLVNETVRGRTTRDDVFVASNPEFLREGFAIADFEQPDRIVLGCDDARSEALLSELYATFAAPLIVVSVQTAQTIKYAANAFLATKISFINEIARICERDGDIDAVIEGISADHRIGRSFFDAGLGFGGSCLPKDVDALRLSARDRGVEPVLLDAVMDVNRRQITRTITKTAELTEGLRDRHVTVWGLAFKPGTDDVRASPALLLVEALLVAGASVAAHDPLAADNARAVLDERVVFFDGDHQLEAARGSDALIVATEWPMYRLPDFAGLAAIVRGRVIVDARNALDPQAARDAGFVYAGVGR
jgi:UDPglucose 6-dehydrogenase